MVGRRDPQRRRRRGEPSAFGNQVNEGRVALIAVAAAVLAVLAGAAPTGSTGIGVVMVGVAVGAVVWAAASAPWWTLSLVAGVSAVTAGQFVLAAVGAAAFVGALFIGARRDHQSELRSLVAERQREAQEAQGVRELLGRTKAELGDLQVEHKALLEQLDAARQRVAELEQQLQDAPTTSAAAGPPGCCS